MRTSIVSILVLMLGISRHSASSSRRLPRGLQRPSQRCRCGRPRLRKGHGSCRGPRRCRLPRQDLREGLQLHPWRTAGRRAARRCGWRTKEQWLASVRQGTVSLSRSRLGEGRDALATSPSPTGMQGPEQDREERPHGLVRAWIYAFRNGATGSIDLAPDRARADEHSIIGPFRRA